jgi:hypothetical protein
MKFPIDFQTADNNQKVLMPILYQKCIQFLRKHEKVILYIFLYLCDCYNGNARPTLLFSEPEGSTPLIALIDTGFYFIDLCLI